MTDWLLSAIGLIILLLAGESLVKGAINLSLKLGVPALIISLTIVAFGTSAPELIIAINATLSGTSGIAMGNVVGSNTANILLVLGLPALLATLDASKCDTKMNYFFMIFATLVFILLASMGSFAPWQGGILLALLFVYLLNNLKNAREYLSNVEDTCQTPSSELEQPNPVMVNWKIAALILLGIFGLPLGADLLVDGASSIASSFGISDAVIGLTLIAVGTSLPELATTIVSAFRNRADVAIGNVIGSNIFNLLGIIGITAMVGHVAVAPIFLRFDLWVMLVSSLILIPFVLYKVKLTRVWGFTLTVLYLCYVQFVLM